MEGYQIEVRELTVNGKSHFGEWLFDLDKSQRAEVRARLERVRLGNLGSHRNLRFGILELKFHSGLRIYGGWEGKVFLLLIVGGDKRSQDRDIRTAEEIWLSYTKGK